MKKPIFILAIFLLIVVWAAPADAGFPWFRRKIKVVAPEPTTTTMSTIVLQPRPAPIVIKSGGGTNSTIMCFIDEDRNVKIAPGVSANQVILRMTEIVQNQQQLMSATLNQIHQRDQALLRSLRELTALYAVIRKSTPVSTGASKPLDR